MVLSEYREALGEREVEHMDCEWKRAMNYMWSSKSMRRSFGCGFSILGNGGMLLVVVIAMLIPMFVKLLGFTVNESVCTWAYVVAFFSHLMTQVIAAEVPVIIYGISGKGMGGIPFAKWIMTKGIIINQLIYYVCGFALIMGIHGINIAAGVADVSWVDDLLFLTGLFFFVEAVFQSVWSLIKKEGAMQGSFGGTLSAALVALPTVTGRVRMSVGTACLFQVIFVAVGVVLVYFSLLRRYRKRSGIQR